MMRSLFYIFFLLQTICACDKLPKLGPGDKDQLASAAEDECGFVQNSYGQRVSWKQSLPVNISIDSSFPASYETALKAAAKQWEDAAGKSLFLFTRVSASENIIYWQSDWDESQKAQQAVTTLRWYKNNLVEAILKIDARFYSFYTSTPNSSSEVHLQSLLVHELGHVLGLKHKAVSPTVMWATLRGATVRDELSAADIASLKCEY